MAFFKKIFSAKGGSASGGKKKEEKSEKANKDESETQILKKPADKSRSAGSARLMTGVLLSPKITEKTSGASGVGKYAFVVAGRSNKPEIKRAVEAKYGVEVLSVNTVNLPGKERKRGRQIGWKPGYKKAVVTLKAEQTIEIQ